ncbi:F-actin capping protein, beta subunit [Nitzschia inconspicua]|uniref:F-actin capping protein, beta subunit n=1 Tax=Nitzschia inconspicua TaxID=303405 RepID=A0A9K3LJZ0_9STRA|nr:F-actin capping protein, beta subunit [Nitzschia inconspicua]
MTDTAATITNTILQKSDPSALHETVQALETLKVQEQREQQKEEQSKVLLFWKGGSSAKHYLPLQYLEPEGSKDFDNDEKAFFKVDGYNQVVVHHNNQNKDTSSFSSSYASPHTGKCYSGNQTNVQFNEADTTLYQTQRRDQQDNSIMEHDVQIFQKAANEVWDSYRQLYYGFDHSVGSVFIKLKQDGVTLEAFFGIHKCTTTTTDDHPVARWDSVHIVTIGIPNITTTTKTCDYKIDSAVWCSLQQSQGGTRHVIDADNLKSTTHICPATTSTAATLVKETTRTCKLLGSLNTTTNTTIPTAAHIENIGTILEQIEMDFRSQLERVVMPKAIEVMQSIYREPGKSATVHLMDDDNDGINNNDKNNDDNTKEQKKPSTGTGMGVGKDMIGDIADSAKSKDSEKIVQTVEQQKKDNNNDTTTASAAAAASNEYTNMRASLKSPTLSTPKAKVIGLSSSIDGATPEFINFRDKLKSPIQK